MRVLLCLVLLIGSSAQQVSAMTAGSATLEWTPTTETTVRYDLRWSHFANGWTWESIVSNLDSTAGRYLHLFPVLPETTGDRGACWDARAVRGGLASPWLSESGKQQCLQVPITSPIPAPVPIPMPLPVPMAASVPLLQPSSIQTPAATITQSGDSVTIQCDPSRFTRAKTIGTGTKRVITCLK